MGTITIGYVLFGPTRVDVGNPNYANAMRRIEDVKQALQRWLAAWERSGAEANLVVDRRVLYYDDFPGNDPTVYKSLLDVNPTLLIEGLVDAWETESDDLHHRDLPESFKCPGKKVVCSLLREGEDERDYPVHETLALADKFGLLPIFGIE
jgi:hypothetical protein